jgi:hypothetical protein
MCCEKGTYQPQAGKTACTSCEPGKFSTAEGATSCIECLEGQFSSVVPVGSPITQCTQCLAGKYSDRKGMPQCTACSGSTIYQPGQGKTSCEKCPAGYKNKTDLAVNADRGFRDISEVCMICGVGKYSDGVAKACEDCPKGTFSSLPGSNACSMCIGNTTTSATGARSMGECACIDGKFDAGNGVCVPCGTCVHNEYVFSECSATGSDVKCAACEPCSSVGSYAPPQSMCKGFGKEARAACTACTPVICR